MIGYRTMAPLAEAAIREALQMALPPRAR